jgi:heme exporter protein A
LVLSPSLSKDEDALNSFISLTIANLTCIRAQRVLFRDLNFTVAAGQTLAIEGPNGSGQTSLLRMVAGFIAPAAGTIKLALGEEISEADELGKRSGWLGHQDAAKPQLTPLEVLRFFSELYGDAADIAAALAAAGLERCASLPCQYLSAGQKKRLALARLQIGRRPLWLLDEPLASLDSQGKKFAADLIADHCASGGIVLAATHEPLGLACSRLVLGRL